MKRLPLIFLFFILCASVNAVANVTDCYQPTANESTSCGGLDTGIYALEAETSVKGNFYINYTKPYGAFNGIWEVKHGTLSTYNISIPNACWVYNDEKLILKIVSEDAGASVLSKPYCMNATDVWKGIGQSPEGSETANLIPNSENNLFDNNYSSFAKFDDSNWYANYNDDSTIYEESMYWNLSFIGNSFFTEPEPINALHNDKYTAYNTTIDLGVAQVHLGQFGSRAGQIILEVYADIDTSLLYLVFRDFDTQTVLNWTNITLTVVHDYYSEAFNVSTGYLTLNISYTGMYRLDYTAQDYIQSTNFVEIPLYQDYTYLLYLQNGSKPQNVTAIVYDENEKELPGAYIYVLKYDLGSNSYIVSEVQKTNFIGTAELHIIPDTALYQFMIKYNGAFVYISPQETVIYNTEDTLTFRVNTGDDFLTTYNDIDALNARLSFVSTGNRTGYFRLAVDSSQEGYVCLKYYRYTRGGLSLENETCNYANTGIFTLNVNATLYNQDVTYLAQSFVTYTGDPQDYPIATMTKTYRISTSLPDVATETNFGIIIAIILVIVTFGIWVAKPEIGSIALGGVWFLIWKLNLVSTTLDIAIMFVFLGMLVGTAMRKWGEQN